jgi:hypothetical protein
VGGGGGVIVHSSVSVCGTGLGFEPGRVLGLKSVPRWSFGLDSVPYWTGLCAKIGSRTGFCATVGLGPDSVPIICALH